MQRKQLYGCQLINKFIMTKILILYAIIAVLAVSCSKKTDAPAPSLAGFYTGTYDTIGTNRSHAFTIIIRDDNKTSSIAFQVSPTTDIHFNGSIAINNQIFNGKFYTSQYGIGEKQIIIENGAKTSISQDTNLKGKWRDANNSNISGTFSVISNYAL